MSRSTHILSRCTQNNLPEINLPLFMMLNERSEHLLRVRGLIFEIRKKNVFFRASESW